MVYYDATHVVYHQKRKKVLLMKKILALVLALMMALSLSSVLAEATPVETVEQLYEGVWVQFEDGFEFYVPADWVQYETTVEMNAQGIFYMCGTADASYMCSLAWKPLEAETTIEEAYAAMQANYPGANLVDVNGIGIIAYIDAENGLLNCIAMDAAEPGMYMFAFSPADDEEFQLLASCIASSIRNIETTL